LKCNLERVYIPPAHIRPLGHIHPDEAVLEIRLPSACRARLREVRDRKRKYGEPPPLYCED
jgi:hypothetical protein